VPTPSARDFTTLSGLRVITPVNDDVRLWNSPLPCAPIPKATVELRGISLGDGFRTNPSAENPPAVKSHLNK
jgi:hypothetical protein